MKFILKNIISFLRHEKMIFFIIVLCVFASSIVLNFSCGLIYHFHRQKMDAELNLHELIPVINSENGLTKKEFQLFVESLDEKTLNATNVIYASSIIEEFPYNEYGEFCMRFNIRNGKYQICELTKEDLEVRNKIKGRFITNAEEASGAYVALVPYDGKEWLEAVNNIKCGDNSIALFGDTYTVVGEFQSSTLTPVIPFLRVPDELQIKEVIFDFQGSITRSIYEDLIQKSNNVIPGKLLFPEIPLPDLDDTLFYNNIILISILIVVLSIINFSSLYVYVIKQRSKSLAILRVCGCSKQRAVLYYVIECLLIAIPMYVIGVVSFILLKKQYLVRIFSYMKDIYSPQIYLYLFILYIIIMIIMLACIVYKNIKREIVQIIKEDTI